MSSKAICIRETLYRAIRCVGAVSWLFARSQEEILPEMSSCPLQS